MMPVFNNFKKNSPLDLRDKHITFMTLYQLKNFFGPNIKSILITEDQYWDMIDDKYISQWIIPSTLESDIIKGLVGIMDCVILKRRIKLKIWIEVE